MDAAAALSFVEHHGVVLVAARGPVPRLTEAIAGEPISGSWWGHPKGHEIYAVLGEVTASRDVLVCRAVAGKVTLVHRRLWPALVRASEHLGVERCARVDQEHTPAGHHVNHETPVAQWAAGAVAAAAGRLTDDEALEALGAWSRAPTSGRRTART
ncbi:MAG TPA: hypothetical protein VKT18_03670 [Acidimicrobiales bacterium]|nr:hypothetical protein [Acidimicrobiales bacterium]